MPAIPLNKRKIFQFGLVISIQKYQDANNQELINVYLL